MSISSVNSVLTRIFSANGDLSSGRIGHYVGLTTVVALTCYDTFQHKKLDPALAAMLLGAGTMGYAITKDGDKVSMSAIDTTKQLEPQKDV